MSAHATSPAVVPAVIGVIADDVTGGTDVAVALRREGLRTLLLFGQPDAEAAQPAHDAVVIALTTRMAPAASAVAESLSALEWMRSRDVPRFYFKYCSTFDSTADGNIGVVLDALAGALAAPSVVQTPSSPEHGRTQYQGHLFVHATLLSESPMRTHPVNPMTDSLLPRVLQAQTSTGVGTIFHREVAAGVDSVRASVAAAEARGERFLLADAIDQADLRVLGAAGVDAVLTAGAAGLAGGLAHAIVAVAGGGARTTMPSAGGGDPDRLGTAPTVVLAGSCSARTLEQIIALKDAGRPHHHLDPVAMPNPSSLASAALEWYDGNSAGDAPLIYSSTDAAGRERVQKALGVARSAEIIGSAFGLIAEGLVARGVRRIITAGGETSGAVVTALGVRGGLIGEEVATGVPWIYTANETPLALLLKSGNFGEPDLLVTASAPHRSCAGQEHPPAATPDDWPKAEEPNQ